MTPLEMTVTETPMMQLQPAMLVDVPMGQPLLPPPGQPVAVGVPLVQAQPPPMSPSLAPQIPMGVPVLPPNPSGHGHDRLHSIARLTYWVTFGGFFS